MQPNGAAPLGMTVVIYAVIAALLIWRNSRPQRITVTRLWVAPIFLVLITALSIWGSASSAQILGIAPPPAWEVAVALLIGALAGIPLGVLRGRHTNVRATDRAGTMYLDASWVTLAIWLGAFILRAVIRSVVGYRSAAGAIVGDALLTFAVAAVIASYYVIYDKYKALEVQAAQTARESVP